MDREGRWFDSTQVGHPVTATKAELLQVVSDALDKQESVNGRKQGANTHGTIELSVSEAIYRR